jgi:hypothetical protein
MKRKALALAARRAHLPLKSLRSPRLLSPLVAVFEAEAHRIAAEVNRLHRDGAFASKSAQDTDAAFYATLLRDFGGTYLGRRPRARPLKKSP